MAGGGKVFGNEDHLRAPRKAVEPLDPASINPTLDLFAPIDITRPNPDWPYIESPEPRRFVVSSQMLQ